MQTEEKQLTYPEKTMYEMVRDVAIAHPNEPAYEFYGKDCSYQNFLQKIDAAAAAFANAGVQKGDAVTICLPNVPQGLSAFYALDKIGAIANMVHPLSAQQEIAFYLRVSESKIIVSVDMFYEKILAATKSLAFPVRILLIRMQDELPAHLKAPYVLTSGRKWLSYPYKGEGELWKHFLASGRGTNVAVAPFDQTRTSVILYSGGTSGTPKGICLSDLNMNALGIQCRSQVSVEFGPGIKMLSCMPMFHGFGLGVNIHTALIYGAKCILMPSFDLKSYAAMIKKKQPNFIAGVPTIYEALLHMPQLDGVKLDFLYGAFCGGDSLSVSLKKKVDDFLKEHGATIQVQEGYGLTECVTASCLTPEDRYKEGSIGLPYPDTFYTIVRPGTDDVLDPMEEGEIILRGPTVMLGYLNNPEETAQTLRMLPDGNVWLYTGDLGYMDEEGFVYFKQRIKRMIITSGYNVYPGQIENVIDSVPEVAYSCVIGVREERRGQKVRAYVVLRDGVTDEAMVLEKIKEQIELHVARYARPREYIFRDALPKTLVGKVAYRLLEEEAEKEIAESEAQAEAEASGQDATGELL